MKGSKENFREMQEQGVDIDNSGQLFEEWMNDEIHLGGEHSVFISNKDLSNDK